MRFNSQRGVSLLMLIIALTVFAGVAIGVVTLLSSRYLSYPYQVQSYQAYALANAGVEFAIRYAKDNNTDPTAPNSFSQSPYSYIPNYPAYKDFTFGNGKFSLSYQAGCPDMLYSKGTIGNGNVAREVILSNFGSYLGTQGGSVYIVSSQITRSCYGAGCAGRICYNGTTTYSCPADPYPGPYSGDRIQITYCNPLTANANNYTMMLEGDANSVMGTVAATKPVSLGRIGFTDNSVSLPVVNGVPTPQNGQPLNVWWAWDFTCGITGPGSQGTPPYCPGPFVMGPGGIYGCPATSYGGGPYANMGLTDCVTSNTGWPYYTPNGHYNSPTVQGWDGTSNPPNAGYPFIWNTDQTNSSSTQYDATCRPVLPCDPAIEIANNSACATCGDYSGCTAQGCPCMAESACAWNFPGCPNGTWPPATPVVYQYHYACFDATTSCNMNMYGAIARSRQTCHFPLGCGDPYGCPAPISNYQISVNANRLTIETIGHLDAVVPVKMYLSFYTWVSVGGNRGLSQAAQPPVLNTFVFTVH